jgi:hypothetical protein
MRLRRPPAPESGVASFDHGVRGIAGATAEVVAAKDDRGPLAGPYGESPVADTGVHVSATD